MPGFGRVVGRRAGALGTALTLYDLWRRLPPHQRRFVAAQARKHGPKVARQLWATRSGRKP
jgi:hypothetical protein